MYVNLYFVIKIYFFAKLETRINIWYSKPLENGRNPGKSGLFRLFDAKYISSQNSCLTNKYYLSLVLRRESLWTAERLQRHSKCSIMYSTAYSVSIILPNSQSRSGYEIPSPLRCPLSLGHSRSKKYRSFDKNSELSKE